MELSVCIPVFNHRDYLVQCLDSVLQQDTAYRYEIIIGDDGSTDGSVEIAEEYRRIHPHIITLLKYQNEKKIIFNGRVTGRKNFIKIFSRARGKYIALLDGDDYWSEKGKVQRQLDFLESNPEYTVCFHNALVINSNTRNDRCVCPDTLESEIGIDQLLEYNPIPTGAVVYRNVLTGKLPPWFIDVPAGDWALHIMHAMQGKVHYMPEVMSVYREHASGVWATIRSDRLALLKARTRQYEVLENVMPERYRDNLRRLRLRSLKKLVELSIGTERLGELGNRWYDYRQLAAASGESVALESLGMLMRRKAPRTYTYAKKVYRAWVK